jgi:hypothetical protein
MIINGRGDFCHDNLQKAYEKIVEDHVKKNNKTKTT